VKGIADCGLRISEWGMETDRQAEILVAKENL